MSNRTFWSKTRRDITLLRQWVAILTNEDNKTPEEDTPSLLALGIPVIGPGPPFLLQLRNMIGNSDELRYLVNRR